ncbi:MAG: flagellar basal body-associated FliL family protein [Desulfovibrio sp.]|jgi:flagellar FliL protein|nr:flagellar basal body-associated FliL family protein [Desulfovibrio sp.]
MADEAATPRKKSKLRLLLVIIIILAVMGGGGAAAWFFFLGERLMPMIQSFTGKEPAAAEEQAPQPPSLTVALPAFITNLADPLGQRIIRLRIEIETADARVKNEVASNNARIRDAILLLLASKTHADLSTPEKKILLKSEITDRLNAILGRGKVSQVFITDLFIQ